MKYIVKVRIPNEPGNEQIRDPQFGMKMKQVLEEVKAEQAYFTTVDGYRGGYIVVNVTDASQLPQIAEPFFLWLSARVDFIPVMTPQDLGNATQGIQNAVKEYAH